MEEMEHSVTIKGQELFIQGCRRRFAVTVQTAQPGDIDALGSNVMLEEHQQPDAGTPQHDGKLTEGIFALQQQIAPTVSQQT